VAAYRQFRECSRSLDAAVREAEGRLLVAAQAGSGADGLGVATVAMWPPVPRREPDEGGRGAANRVRPWLFGRSPDARPSEARARTAEAKIISERGRPPAGGVKMGGGWTGDDAAKRTAHEAERG
jgi:hypothetical protein